MDFLDDATTMEQAMVRRAKLRKFPITGSLELSPLCNMNCDMCYVRLTRTEMEGQGRLRTADEWIAVARQMKEAGVLFLLLTGGEPLLYPEFRRLYIELLHMGFILTINTNATLIDEDWAGFFGKWKPRRINVTLYGSDETAYANLCHYPEGFSKATKGIRLLREQQVDVKISFSVTRQNISMMRQVFAISADMNVPVHIDPYMMPGTRERTASYDIESRVTPREAAQASLDALKLQLSEDFYRQYVMQSIERVNDPDFPRGDVHVSCLAGNCSFTINWQGHMRPCVMMTDPAVSVFEDGFSQAWSEISSRTQELCISVQCTKCRLRPLCKICAAASLLETGDYEGIPEYLCRYSQELYDLLCEEAKSL